MLKQGRSSEYSSLLSEAEHYVFANGRRLELPMLPKPSLTNPGIMGIKKGAICCQTTRYDLLSLLCIKRLIDVTFSTRWIAKIWNTTFQFWSQKVGFIWYANSLPETSSKTICIKLLLILGHPGTNWESSPTCCRHRNRNRYFHFFTLPSILLIIQIGIWAIEFG